MIKSQLVDARNFDEFEPILLKIMAEPDFIGIDLEGHDDDAHEGIKAYRKNDTARVFDLRRTVITGLSVYPDGHDTAYYFNLAHADTENCLHWAKVKNILDAKKADATWVAHNAPFEIANMRLSLGYELESIICTLQMAVSAYGPDDYPEAELITGGLRGMADLAPSIMKAFAGYQNREEFTQQQGHVFGQVCGKTSRAKHSYNGCVYEMSYGYGLKKAVKSHFGVQMTTFEEVLGKKKHMGELTGEEVVAYGCDDSYWAVRLLHHLYGMLAKQSETLVQTFFDQENPMVHVYADIWCEGMAVDAKAIEDRRAEERENYAEVLRALRGDLRHFFPTGPLNESLAKRDSWYAKNGLKYREKLIKWAREANRNNAYDEVLLTSGAVSKPWYQAEGGNPNKLSGPNLSHYMPVRAILYDFLGEKPIVEKGKTQSDGDARGKIVERIKARMEEGDDARLRVIESLNKVASVEQAMKLYLNPYMLLTDPETKKLYPVVSSKLATRRMAASFPNPMQLAKQGETVYVRGFFQGDNRDHLLVSLDWSQVELVLIGELSGDPEFAKAYGQLPYNDLHKVAAADLLSVLYETTVTPEMFTSLKQMPDDLDEPFGFPLVDATGTRLSPSAAYKYNRGTAGGKGCNFGYWYSGALSSVAGARGVSHDKMWEMTEAYRDRFAVGERWRVGTIERLRECGFVELPDGHRRNRYEATTEWAQIIETMWDVYHNEAISTFGRIMTQRIGRRAGNQGVNALIQGSCGTLAKRSILSIRKAIKEMGLRARFLMPIHDELVFSVHYQDVIPFLAMARQKMTHHPEIIKNLKLHCTASVGRSFQPFHAEKTPFGQVELDEAPKGLVCIDGGLIDQVLPQEAVEEVVQYLHAA